MADLSKASLAVSVVAIIVAAAAIGFAFTSIGSLTSQLEESSAKIDEISSSLQALESTFERELGALKEARQREVERLKELEAELAQRRIMDELIAAARREGKVVVYHSWDPRAVEALAKGFEAKYGIEVEWTRKGTGGIRKQFAAEREAGQRIVDVVQFTDPAGFLAAKKRGWLQPFDLSKVPEVAKVPAEYRDPDNYYTAGLGVASVGLFNKKFLPVDQAPKSWKDLLDPKWRGQIAAADPIASGLGLTFVLAMVETYGWEFVEGLAKNEVIWTPGSDPAVALAVTGEKLIALGAGLHDIIVLRQENPDIVGLVPEGDIVPLVLSPIGIAEGAPHPNAALLYLNYALSLEAQNAMQRLSGQIAVRPEATQAPGGAILLADLLKKYKVFIPDWEAFDREEFTNRFRQITGI